MIPTGSALSAGTSGRSDATLALGHHRRSRSIHPIRTRDQSGRGKPSRYRLHPNGGSLKPNSRSKIRANIVASNALE